MFQIKIYQNSCKRLSTVFASSLLSLILPWARSPAARYPLSPRCPRPVDPPPLPRRHSDPTHTPAPNNKHRRYSDVKNPKPDLRQELQNLNLNKQEFDGWLGDEFKEEFEPYPEQFTHDIPLQRSISLDGGVDIFNYLQNIGSDWSGTEVGSAWTIHSDERESLVFEQYRSFEDIPVSQPVKSRRVSDIDTFRRNLALSVLKDSYKGIDTGASISPQIKKLQRCFTFPDKLEEFKEAVKNSVENIDEVYQEPKAHLQIPSSKEFGSRSGLHRVRMLHRSLSFRNSTEDFCNKTDDVKLEDRAPFYRSISTDQRNESTSNAESLPRQRRIGVANVCQGMREVTLRKEVLLKRNMSEFKSCDNISVKRLHSRRLSVEPYVLNHSGIADISPLLKLNHPFSYTKPSIVPTIVITDADSTNVANKISKTSIVSADRTSKIVSIRCDCRICTEEARGSFARKMLSKLFVKIASGRGMVRDRNDRRYQDENNNDSDMYKCIMNVMKLLLGLWLRHLDHN